MVFRFTNIKGYDSNIQLKLALFYNYKESAGSSTVSNNGNRNIRKWSRFAECWAGIGLWAGIWAVTFGILASGILIK